MMKSFRLVFAFSSILIVSGQEFSEDFSETNLDEPYYESESSITFLRSGLVEDLDGALTKSSSISILDDKTTYTKSKPTLSEGLVDEATANNASTTNVMLFKEDSSLDNSTYNTSTANNSLLSDVRDALADNKTNFRGISLSKKKTSSNASTPARIPLLKKKYTPTQNISTTLDSAFESESENQSLNTSIDSDSTDEPFSFFSNTGLPNKGDIPVLNRKVFKARRVTIGEHPYIVSIRRNYSHFLTGSLIKTNVVITVAHPVYHVPIYELGVVMGESYNERGTSINMVLLVALHHRYLRYTLANDLALLLTYGEGNYRFNVRNIKGLYMVKDGPSLNGKVAFVTGWGRCDFTGEEMCLPRSSVYFPDEVSDPMLRSIAFNINDKTLECTDYLRLGLRLHSRAICIGDSREDDPMAPCLGVPGAPLVVQGALLGVLSWGLGCGYTVDLPLVYTDLRKYGTWINEMLQTLETLDKSFLIQLFKATKGYILSDLTISSRYQKPVKPIVSDRPIELTALDDKLARLKAKLYDIRDFIDGGKYHESKKELYRELAVKLEVNDLDNNTLPVYLTDDSDDTDTYEDPLFHNIEEDSYDSSEYYDKLEKLSRLTVRNHSI